jgi:CheY-like chemotaxis protein
MPPLGRVLVVDDEPQVAAMLQDLLVEVGYAVKIAVSGQEALGLVPVYRPDTVLLDLNMPGLPGAEVLEELLRMDALLPVVIVTGTRDLDVARGTLKTGAFDFVPQALRPAGPGADRRRGDQPARPRQVGGCVSQPERGRPHRRYWRSLTVLWQPRCPAAKHC